MKTKPDKKQENPKSPFEHPGGLLKRRSFTPEEQTANTHFTRLLRVYAASYLFYFLAAWFSEFESPNFFSPFFPCLYRSLIAPFAWLQFPMIVIASFLPVFILPVFLLNLFSPIFLIFFLMLTMKLSRSKLNPKKVLLAYRIFFYSGIPLSILYAFYLTSFLEKSLA